MEVSFQGSAGVTGKEDGYAFVVVQVRIAHRRAVQNQRVIQQRLAVGFGHSLQFIQEVRNHADVILVQLSVSLNALLVLAMMGQPVESAINAAFREGTTGTVSAQFEGSDAGNVSHEGEDLQ